MSISDNIADMLTRIRNGQHAKHEYVECYASNMKESIVKILQQEGYIKKYERFDIRKNIFGLRIFLKYHKDKGAICVIKRVSRPGRRAYSSKEKIPVIYNGLGTVVLSTSKGIMTGFDAKVKNVSGEVLCYLF